VKLKERLLAFFAPSRSISWFIIGTATFSLGLQALYDFANDPWQFQGGYSITLEKLSQPRSLPCRRPGIFFTTKATKSTKPAAGQALCPLWLSLAAPVRLRLMPRYVLAIAAGIIAVTLLIVSAIQRNDRRHGVGLFGVQSKYAIAPSSRKLARL